MPVLFACPYACGGCAPVRRLCASALPLSYRRMRVCASGACVCVHVLTIAPGVAHHPMVCVRLRRRRLVCCYRIQHELQVVLSRVGSTLAVRRERIKSTSRSNE